MQPLLQAPMSHRPPWANPRWNQVLDSLELEQPRRLAKLLNQGFPALDQWLNSEVERLLQQEREGLPQAGNLAEAAAEVWPQPQYPNDPLPDQNKPSLSPDQQQQLQAFRELAKARRLSLPGAPPLLPS